MGLLMDRGLMFVSLYDILVLGHPCFIDRTCLRFASRVHIDESTWRECLARRKSMYKQCIRESYTTMIPKAEKTSTSRKEIGNRAKYEVPSQNSKFTRAKQWKANDSEGDINHVCGNTEVVWLKWRSCSKGIDNIW